MDIEMDSDLQRAYDLVWQAVCAEDVFGELLDPQAKKSQLELLEEANVRLSELTDPKAYTLPNDKELALEAKERLQQFYQIAKERIAAGIYGEKRSGTISHRGRPTFRTEKRAYYLGQPIAEGDISTVYDGDCIMGDDFAGRVAIKIITDPADNDLAKNEVRTLKLLHGSGGAQRKHLPVLLDEFKTSDGQAGIVTRYLEDCHDFLSVKEKYPDGIPPKHMVWMLNRLLSAIGYAHSLGIVHGNIEPSHLMIRPKDHNLFVIDWSYAAVDPKNSGDGFKVVNEQFSAPEVAKRKPPLPAADLYSIGLCMIDILGGNVEDKTMPDSVAEDLQRFLQFFCLESAQQRAQDAWQLHGQLEKLIVRLWGPKRFLAFKM